MVKSDTLITLKTNLYRAHNPRWAFLPGSGEGAALFGGRFNAKGTKALYTSMTGQGAWAEAQQGFSRKAQPLLVCMYEVDCVGVIDLTNEKTRQLWSVSEEELACPWKLEQAKGAIPSSWRLTNNLISQGVSGIIVPSFAPGASSDMKNVIFWRWGKTIPHKVAVIDDHERLPKNQKSWE